MRYHHHSFEIQNTGELRSILLEIQHQNEHSIKESLSHHLEDQNLSVRKIAAICHDQIAKKQQYLTNVLEFSLYLLNEVEVKNDSLAKNSERIARMQLDFSKLLADNEELMKKIELIEDENYHFKNKIEEAETYISQVSHNSQSLKSALMQPLPSIEVHPIHISTFSKNYSHLTERPSLTSQNTSFNEQFKKKIHKYEENLEEKSGCIIELERQVRKLKEKIMVLENELSTKSSQLELSELYFKEKLDIIASSEALNRSNDVSISQIQLNSVFRKELSRVDSAKSIESIVQSQNSENEFQNQEKSQYFENEEIYCKRNSVVRRSLMQDFVTDFGFESHSEIYSSILGSQSMSPDNSCILRNRKKSISVSTADMRRTLSKGVQTSFDPVTKIIRRNPPQNFKKPQQKTDKMETSFLGIGSFTSLFSKKKIPNENDFCSALQKQTQSRNDHSIMGESIGDLFKGIFDYATKKIVTNRIHKKSKTSLNQSFTEEIYKSSQKKKTYVKGMKF